MSHTDPRIDGAGLGIDDERAAWRASGLDERRLDHVAFPEIDLDAVDTTTMLLGRRLDAPVIVALASEGRTPSARAARSLVAAAQSARIAIDAGAPPSDPDDVESMRELRELAPDVPLLISVPATELHGDRGLDACHRAVTAAGADALVVRASPLTDALEGRPSRYGGIIPRVQELVRHLDVPVLAGAAGHGMDEGSVRRLAAAGVVGVDVAGRGEQPDTQARPDDPAHARVLEEFHDWGHSTVASVVAARRAFPDGLVIGSGGLRGGVDAAKVIALGADIAGIGVPLARAASVSRHAIDDRLRAIVAALRVAMLCAGARTTADLRSTPIRDAS